jgi:ABC-type lipoprotein release transport system permease subunit
MGRLLLISRLAARDLRRRPAEAALLLLAIAATTTTLTLGLVLHGVTSGAYESTRKATAGPDVVASVAPVPRRYGGQPADLAGLKGLANAPGVVGHSGPYPVTWATLKAPRQQWPVRVDGRDRAPAPIDQPKLTQGAWVRDGGVVVEAAFADAVGVHIGDPIALSALDLDLGRPVADHTSRSFRVVGVAVTAAAVPYPEVSCLALCPGNAGLVWLTRADTRTLAPPGGSLYVEYLKLADPAAAPAFVAERSRPTGPPPVGISPSPSDLQSPSLEAWQDIRAASGNLVENQRQALLTGAWLLALLAVASLAVLVGGRMADQIRRVGLLKAVGGTPGLVAAVLLAEYVVVALLAAAAGLALGWLAAPLLTDPSAGLLGRTGAPPLTMSTVGIVTAVALAVAVAATLIPAVRAARTSTVLALADSARPPRRSGWVIALSARLPVPLLLGLRLAARRPRRVVLAALSIAITVSGVVAALAAHADINTSQLTRASVEDQLSGNGGSVVDPSRADRLNQVLLLITITLFALAAVNAIFITWATALDARRSSALARALGATPRQVGTGLSAAQVLPALAGALLGIPGGIELITAADPDPTTTMPPLWQLLAVVPMTVLVVAVLTAVPARIGARRPIAGVLQSERA